jgi:peptidylprolyl isomerase
MLRVVCVAQALLLLILAGCGGDSTAAPPDVSGPPADAAKTSSGLATRVLKQGAGSRHPGPRDSVSVHYTGWTTDGRMFDTSVTSNEPTTFRLDEVIPGWTEGLQLMVEGEKRRLWVPEKLAYGGAPGAPAGTLVFDVELIRINAPRF